MRLLNGYYDGTTIVPEDGASLVKGQRVMIYVLEERRPAEKKKMDLSRYVGQDERMLDIDAQEFVNRLRDNDRV